MTTRDFGTVDGYGISVYALEKNKMIDGDPSARAVQFFLDSDVIPLNLIGDGLLRRCRWQAKTKGKCTGPDRRHARRRCFLWRNLRRPQHLGAECEVALHSAGVTYLEDAAASSRI